MTKAPEMRERSVVRLSVTPSAKYSCSGPPPMLAKGKTARNLDLVQTRAWFDFPLLLNDNRIAKVVFQKSPEGEAMLAKAFDAWK